MNMTNNIMVCVTQQKTCERLIKNGAEIRKKLSGDLYVIHVAKEGVNFLGNKQESEALEYLFEKSKEVGADLTVLRADNVIDTIAEFAHNKKIGHIVLGESPIGSSEEGVIAEIKNRLPNSHIHIIPAE